MGFIEDIEALNLSDEDKQALIRSHSGEVAPLREERDTLRSRDRRESVETEIRDLADAGFEDAPRALAYARRVFLSPDAEESGAVLFADHELGLNGEQATGAHSREDVSAAKVLRTFLSLLPRDDDGKLAVNLSDQGIAAEDEGRPETGNKLTAEEKSKGARERLGAVTGRPIDRTRKRYQRHAGTIAGE